MQEQHETRALEVTAYVALLWSLYWWGFNPIPYVLDFISR